jgi:pimeloyl-ACP methyl ester carboxylesterase
MSDVPRSLDTLARRFDAGVLDGATDGARIRLEVDGEGSWDALLSGDGLSLEPADRRARVDALLTADASTWSAIAKDLRGGMRAYRARRLSIRRNLHLGVGFLAATGDRPPEGGLVFRRVEATMGELSYLEAGVGRPVVMLHGLGATKASFLPSIEALADSHRAIALDLPGFGESVKPIGAAYDARYFARAVEAALDALELDRADVIGNSMGGRVALELALRVPARVRKVALLAPSLSWLRPRPWARYLRWVRPELGLMQPAPRPVVERIVRALVPHASDGWVAAGVDEFLRSYVTARGRAAFYAAARSIYLEEPDGPEGLWTRLPELEPPALFVWGRHDPLVPIGFSRHVERALPSAAHVELDCGHVPQLERPRQTHAALHEFFAARGPRRRRAA